MNLSRLLIFTVFFFVNYISFFAQYTEVINSNKPGFSESPYSVGSGVYQIESNIFLRKTSIEPTFSIPQSLGLDLVFRTSFFLEKLELNARLTYQQDKVAFKNIFSSHYFTSGFSDMIIGAKYLVYQKEYENKSKEIYSWQKRNGFDKRRLIPSVALYLGINTGFLHDLHKTGSITPKIGVLLQQNLTKYFNVITNIFYDNIGSDFSELSFIVTATNNLSNQWSIFFENQTVFEKYQQNTNLGIGLAFLYNKNLQFNTSSKFIFEEKSEGFYIGLGVSYRIDKHEDPLKELDSIDLGLEDTPISEYNKKENSFFSKLFSIFKKKGKLSRAKPERKRKRKSKKKKGFLGLFGKKKLKESTIDNPEEEIK